LDGSDKVFITIDDEISISKDQTIFVSIDIDASLCKTKGEYRGTIEIRANPDKTYISGSIPITINVCPPAAKSSASTAQIDRGKIEDLSLGL
jgi:hypothetical protein